MACNFKRRRPLFFKLTARNIFLIAALSLSRQAIAQEKEPLRDKWLLGAGAVPGRLTVIDKNFSSIPYSGNTWGATLSLKHQRKKSFHELQAYYTTGSLETGKVTGDVKQTYLTIDYINLYKLGSTEFTSFAYKAGAGINVLYAQREYAGFINNSESFEFAVSLSGVLEAAYFFDNKLAGFSISDRICLPLISVATQPGFENDAGIIYDKDSRIAGFSSFFRVINVLAIQKNIFDRQKLSLSYSWDYYRFSHYREVKQANHRLGLTYYFIF